MIEVHQTDGQHLPGSKHSGAPWPGNLELNRQKIAQLFQKHGYTVECLVNDQVLAWK